MLQSDPSDERDELLPYLRAISISKRGIDFSHVLTMWIKPQEREKYRLRRNDVLISEGGDAGRTALFDADGDYYFQNAINRVRPLDGDQLTSRFLFYWFTFLKLSGYVQLICNVATIPHFTAEKVKAAPFTLPPIETQKRITAFLDEKTTQIDALIEKKRALLDRLAEKRQALITQAVTKGLNPTAPMKDSGIDWLGKIPAHWEFWPLKRVISTSTYGISASLAPSGEVAILRMGNLQNGELDFTDLRYLDQVEPDLLIRTRDVIFNRTNSLDLVGKAAIFRGNYHGQLSLASYLVRFRFDVRYDPDFANYAMGTDVLMSLGRTLALPSIGQANLNPNRYAAISFPIPPILEQREIVRHIADQLSRLSQFETKIVVSIERLIEYRSALIIAAITGQIESL